MVREDVGVKASEREIHACFWNTNSWKGGDPLNDELTP